MNQTHLVSLTNPAAKAADITQAIDGAGSLFRDRLRLQSPI